MTDIPLGLHIDRFLVLVQQPKDLFEKWLSMIPGRRICDAAELKGVRMPVFCLRSGTNVWFEGLCFPGE